MNIYDVIIIGAGPAGLTAAIYILRAHLKTLIIESPSIMSQAGYAVLIENFPGFPQGISGSQFIANLKIQVTSLGAELIVDDVGGIEFLKEQKQEILQVNTSDKAYQALSLIVASGASARKLGIPDEDRFLGKGLSYCATCDGVFFKDKIIAVIGGGDTAIEEALFLTRFAKKIYIIHRRDRLRAVKSLQDKALSSQKIEIIWSSVVNEILGEGTVAGLRLKNRVTAKRDDLECQGVFISIGKRPNTDFLKDIVALDKNSYIRADKDLHTSKTGIFACGDCRDTFLRQIITACGDGALAAYSCQQYIEHLKGKVYS